MEESNRVWSSDNVLAAKCIQTAVTHLEGMRALTVPKARRAASLLGYGWWASVVRTAEGVRQLYASGLGHEAAPLVRTALHHAVALVWLAQDPDTVLKAVAWEHQWKRHRLFERARVRQWDLSALDELPERPAKPKPAGVAYLAKLEDLCNHIDQTNMYVPYMIESSYVHPSGLGADSYLDERDGTGYIRPTSKAPVTPLSGTVIFVAQATEALGTLTGDDGMTRLAEKIIARMQVAASDKPPAKGSPRS